MYCLESSGGSAGDMLTVSEAAYEILHASCAIYPSVKTFAVQVLDGHHINRKKQEDIIAESQIEK
ncbi:uncharacterized protein N7479_005846 [Penicillium vulpinum]|uniref:uncharacterized protein n=1 Tax=Penicillium vulpinum TaxID=29845 RepID=UPI0025473B12|nr:uncharacterized protein N7479_005846 [Penicillium vulpinum]KAJ5958696.1 hypothetical protein N7479_005846 [Penicillium vulpinum]